MSRANIFGLVAALALAMFFYWIYTNETLVFKGFEVRSEQTDALTEERSIGVRYSNLNCVLDGSCVLTLFGWLKLLLYFLALPLLVFVIVRKRIMKKEQAAAQETSN